MTAQQILQCGTHISKERATKVVMVGGGGGWFVENQDLNKEPGGGVDGYSGKAYEYNIQDTSLKMGGLWRKPVRCGGVLLKIDR